MKFLRQAAIIILFSLLGELCRFLIPFPIPAAIYGMVLLFAALALKLLKLPAVKDAGSFLTGILPVLFVAPCVNLLSCWDSLQAALLPIVIIMVVTTVLVFAAAALVTQWILTRRKGGKDTG